MPNIVVMPPDISSGRIYYGDQAGYEALPRMPEKTDEQRQAEAEANRAWVSRVAALQAERQAEMDRNKLPFEDIPGAYKWVQRDGAWGGEIDPKAIEAASAAVEAATQFQGIRGYQQALGEGKSPAAAMAEFAPLIFAKKYPSSLARQADATPRVHNIGGVGYMQDPSNPAALIPVTPPKAQAQIEEREVGGQNISFVRQPSGAMTPIKFPEDKQLKALENSKAAADKAVEDAQAKYNAATATRTEVRPPGAGLFGTGIMARQGSTNQVPLVIGKADEAEANLMAARARQNAAASNLTAYAQSKMSSQKPTGTTNLPTAAPQQPTGTANLATGTSGGQGRKYTQADVDKALKDAGGNRVRARQLLRDAGFKLD